MRGTLPGVFSIAGSASATPAPRSCSTLFHVELGFIPTKLLDGSIATSSSPAVDRQKGGSPTPPGGDSRGE